MMPDPVVWPWAVVSLFGVLLAAIEVSCLAATGRLHRSDGDLIIYAIWVNIIFFAVVGVLAILLEIGAESAGLMHPGHGVFASVLAGVLSATAIVMVGFSWYRHAYPEQPCSHPARKRASLGFESLGLLAAAAVVLGGILGVVNFLPTVASFAVPAAGAIGVSATCLPVSLLREGRSFSGSVNNCT